MKKRIGIFNVFFYPQVANVIYTIKNKTVKTHNIFSK